VLLPGIEQRTVQPTALSLYCLRSTGYK